MILVKFVIANSDPFIVLILLLASSCEEPLET